MAGEASSGVIVSRAGLERAGFLFIALELFVGEHFILGPLGTLALLASDLRDPLFGRAPFSLDDPLEFIGQDATGQETVERLRTLLLAFDLEAGGDVLEIDARRDLVDVLAAVAARADELLLDVLLEQPELLHPLAESLFLVGGDVEDGHAKGLSAIRRGDSR
jgi:hypothetical protein